MKGKSSAIVVLGVLAATALCVLNCASATAEAPVRTDSDDAAKRRIPHMLLPGFTVRELPVKLTSLNNVEYAADGRLFAGGYDGRFHLLRDTDADGLEDKVDTFWPETSANYPLGVAVKDGNPHFVLADEIVRFRDTDGDLVPDKRETVLKGFDDPELANAPYLHHRRVDSSMAIALGPDGAWYVSLGNAGFSNAYWHDEQGIPHYTTDKRRGCLLRFGDDGKVEQIASGLRYVMSLQVNKHGDLFGTDQEGATWVPNGNPFDELLHIQAGRHYGFPPRHPKWLPDVVDEPSVWDYSPQHQSTCGFRFNTPVPGRGRFGPGFWEDDAIVTGESRGKLWRTKLAKTSVGYVATTQLIARMDLLVVDCAISPSGDLVICCHTGEPDWGNGPAGKGRIFKISDTDRQAAKPVLAWAESQTETVIAFDRALDRARWANAMQHIQIETGHFVSAADRLERMRPPYAVVGYQQAQARTLLPIKRSRISNDGRRLVIQTEPRSAALNYAVTVPGQCDMAHDLSGLAVQWRGADSEWSGWLPHADFTVARAFTAASAAHDQLWQQIARSGTLVLRTQLDLWKMLQPMTQPNSQLDYTPEPESVTLAFKSDAELKIEAVGAVVRRVSDHESHLTVIAASEDDWQPLEIKVATPASLLDVSFSTARDPRPRPLPTRRLLMPFTQPAPPTIERRRIPQIAEGNWMAGHAVYNGKASCSKCHVMRGEGARVGPDLNNLIHRDYASVLRDIIEPSATINPDAVGYTVLLDNGKVISGTRVGESAEELHIVPASGEVEKLKKSSITDIQPMKVSPMPAGLEKLLSKEELRDLMTFLLLEKPEEGGN